MSPVDCERFSPRWALHIRERSRESRLDAQHAEPEVVAAGVFGPIGSLMRRKPDRRLDAGHQPLAQGKLNLWGLAFAGRCGSDAEATLCKLALPRRPRRLFPAIRLLAAVVGGVIGCRLCTRMHNSRRRGAGCSHGIGAAHQCAGSCQPHRQRQARDPSSGCEPHSRHWTHLRVQFASP